MKKPTLVKPTLNKPMAALEFAEGKKRNELVSEAGRRVFNAPEGHRRLTINLPIELHKKLKLAAVNRDMTATDIILILLEKDLK
jgi:hypothetical protein